MSNTCTEQVPAAGPDDLAAPVDQLAKAERHMARAVALAGRLAGSGVCERVEGLPLEHFLGLAARLTGSDRRMLVAAGEALEDLPVTGGLFAEGKLSWGQVRAIVAAGRRLRRDDRARLDARIAATVAERGGVDAFDPDQLVWAVDEAVDELRSRRAVERAEQRQAERNFLAVQAGFDGGLRLYGECDPVTGAGVLNALDAAAGRPPPPGDADADADDEEAAAADGATSRGRQYAAALARICRDWLGGDSGRPARPLLVSCIDLSQASAHPSGTVELAVRGPLPRISAATLERLASDADLRAVIFDGARPLAVSAKVNAASIPAATRIAVGARDRGCRFPGSQDPLAHADLHHVVERARGGDHHPDGIVAVSRRHHTLIHRYGWRLTLDPDTGEVTARRGDRAWRSLPRATRLSWGTGPGDDRGPPETPHETASGDGSVRPELRQPLAASPGDLPF